jgi:hypothetical protein
MIKHQGKNVKCVGGRVIGSRWKGQLRRGNRSSTPEPSAFSNEIKMRGVQVAIHGFSGSVNRFMMKGRPKFFLTDLFDIFKDEFMKMPIPEYLVAKLYWWWLIS